jgi:hypothetical protein
VQNTRQTIRIIPSSVGLRRGGSRPSFLSIAIAARRSSHPLFVPGIIGWRRRVSVPKQVPMVRGDLVSEVGLHGRKYHASASKANDAHVPRHAASKDLPCLPFRNSLVVSYLGERRGEVTNIL